MGDSDLALPLTDLPGELRERLRVCFDLAPSVERK